MNNGNQVSYKEVVDKTLSRFSFIAPHFNDDLGLNAINDLIKLMKVALEMEKKVVWAEVINGKAFLPPDLYLLESIAKSTEDTIEKADCKPNSLVSMRWNTDTFNRKYHASDLDYRCVSPYAYTVNSSCVFPNFDSGVIAIAYQAVPMDDSGYPMLPFNESWLQAATFQIAWYVATDMWLNNKITPDKMQYLEQQRDWYLAQASVDSRMPNKDRRETGRNIRSKSIPDVNAHETMFRNIQMPEARDYNGQYGR